ncbi:MAG: helix-turn-helix domain-containing protein [Anaerolineae bacterium]|nr:helix-turn-helix domain-containing protein [Anaerolineae bacterium]
MSDEHDTLRVFDNWLVVAEAVDLTGFSVEHLHRLAQDQRVEAVKLGGRWLFKRESLLAFAAKADRGEAPGREAGVNDTISPDETAENQGSE